MRGETATFGAGLVSELVNAGVRVAAGLPDTWLVPVIHALVDEPSVTYLPVSREEEAVSIAAGAALAGIRGAAICQSAGVLLSINALAGFAQHHELPFVMIVADRGDLHDGYFYHIYKRRALGPVLRDIGIPTVDVVSRTDLDRVGAAVTHAQLQRRPVAVLLTSETRRHESWR